MNEFLVVVESSKNNFSAYSPDVPGCIATGSTKEETLDLMRQAITLHLGGLKEDGLPIPSPSSTAEYLAV